MLDMRFERKGVSKVTTLTLQRSLLTPAALRGPTLSASQRG